MPSDNRVSIPYQNQFSTLPPQCYSEVQPTAVSSPKWIQFNQPLAVELGLDAQALDSDAGLAMFAGNVVPDNAKPLAMVYAGHQFGGWAPRLGDGRAVLLGDLIDTHGEYREIQLKGAGRTPYSRHGDGRAWLGPILREYLVSEAMAALDVPTTRALAAVSTGESVFREGAVPGAIITRVARSHVRVGTFQYFISRGDLSAIDALIRHMGAICYPDILQSDNAAAALFKHVIDRQAALVAQWQSIGFIHGVMNTDNMAISGETIDYGPCAFLDEYNPKKVFSSIDQMGRYAYINQPAAAHWNLSNFAQALLPFINENQDAAVEQAQSMLDEFPSLYETEYKKRMFAKIGIGQSQDSDSALLNELLSTMHESEADFTLTFNYLTSTVASDETLTTITQRYFEAPASLQAWVTQWHERLKSDAGNAEHATLMQQSNPQVIPRNHRIEACIQAALADDYKPFHTLLSALQSPYELASGDIELAQKPANDELVTQTFCGT